ncbi:MAG: hypothetical protein FWG25_01745 [Promicromonosporaceae bacterium]|nr:hypothetical protein [Promicromonosporaceae bacterium]
MIRLHAIAEADAIPEPLAVRFLAIWNEARREANAGFQSALKEFQVERAELHSELDSLTEELAGSEERTEALSSEITKLKAELTAEHKLADSLRSDLTTANDAGNALRLENASLTATVASLEKQLTALLAKIEPGHR